MPIGQPLKVDSRAMIESFIATRAGLTNERHRAMMDILIKHAQAELVDHDMDALMSTMIPEPRFLWYGTTGMTSFTGYEATREYYCGFFEIPENASAMAAEKLIVGDDAVVMEGWALMSPDLLKTAFPEVDLTVDPERPAIIKKRLCVIFPFEDGLMTGEVHYFDGSPGPDDVVYQDVAS